MRRHLLLIAAALTALLSAVSCSVEEISAIPPEAKLSASRVIPPEEALGNLDALLVDIYGHPQVRFLTLKISCILIGGGKASLTVIMMKEFSTRRCASV